MIIKRNRESILVTISALMALIGLFYYGNKLLIKPLEESAEEISTTFEIQQSLIEEYPPQEELFSEYESKYAEAEVVIPLNAQANQAIINLETLASKANVSVLSLSRVGEQERIWNVSSFTYSKSGEEDYTASLNFDLYYRIENKD